MRFFWCFFLFISFWPWEQDADRLKKSSFELSGPPAQLKTLRVALFYEKPHVRMNIPAPYVIETVSPREALEKGPALSSVMVRRDPQGIRIGSTLYRVEGLRIESRSRELEVEDRKYRDAVQVLKNPNGSLTVVNEIDVEDYLPGVLPAEMNPAWHEEALKAQAVVSRTYAIFKNIENKDFPFTLSSDVGSQVYRGKSIEHAAANRAVEKTRGEILTYRGKIFPAFFHSTCGGGTTRADYQWKIESHPSLKGVECPYCRGSQYYSWKFEFSAAEIRKRLAKAGKDVSAIEEIKPEKVDASGRPRFFAVRHPGGSLEIPANEFRLALGADRMRSTRVTISRNGEKFLFRGKGWGHGVGMCQVGAKQLAQLGYDYTDILRYYYPASEIRSLERFVGRVPEQSEPLRTEAAEEEEEEEEEENLFKGWFRKVKNYFEEY